jgi:hypothetical protein
MDQRLRIHFIAIYDRGENGKALAHTPHEAELNDRARRPHDLPAAPGMPGSRVSLQCHGVTVDCGRP